MLAEAIQLETLRQKIEDSEFEAGNQSDYLDRGQPNAAQAKRAKELIAQLNSQTETAKTELKQLIASVRAQQPQAVEEWVNFQYLQWIDFLPASCLVLFTGAIARIFIRGYALDSVALIYFQNCHHDFSPVFPALERLSFLTLSL